MTTEAETTTGTETPRHSWPGLRRHLCSLIQNRLWLQVLVAMCLGVGFGTLIGPAVGTKT